MPLGSARRAFLAVGGLVVASCGGDDGARAEDHVRAACAARAEVANGAAEVIASGSESLRAGLERARVKALTEAKAAAELDGKYDAFAEGFEAEDEVVTDPDSDRQLEANTARRNVIDPTCRDLNE